MFEGINSFLIAWRFTGCAINLCSFSGLEIKKTEFNNCEIKETDFFDSDISEGSFVGCDLGESRFSNTNLTKTNFVGAKNYQINPEDNNIKKAKFSFPDCVSLLEGLGVEVVY